MTGGAKLLGFACGMLQVRADRCPRPLPSRPLPPAVARPIPLVVTPCGFVSCEIISLR